jgi:hypothetical protein
MKFDELLAHVKEIHPNFEASVDLFGQLDLRNPTPGVLIDYAHAVNESMAKNYRFLIDKSIDSRQIEKQTNTSKHLNSIVEDLADDFISADLLKQLYLVFEEIRDVRNKRGTISHGHLGPVAEIKPHLARFALDLSLSNARFILANAYLREPTSVKLPYTLAEDDQVLESRKEFHRLLDRKGRRIGGSVYSWLIYEHDYPLYETELDLFENDIPSSLKDYKE